jgi:hypothetical protein
MPRTRPSARKSNASRQPARQAGMAGADLFEHELRIADLDVQPVYLHLRTRIDVTLPTSWAWLQLGYCLLRDARAGFQRGRGAWRTARRRRSFRYLVVALTVTGSASGGGALHDHFQQWLVHLLTLLR